MAKTSSQRRTPKARVPAVARHLKIRGSKARTRLANSILRVRARDRKPGTVDYRKDRGLYGWTVQPEQHFTKALGTALRRKTAGKDQGVRVLDKGVGEGKTSADAKAIAPDRIHVTALSLSDSISKENRKVLDSVKRGVGLRVRYPEKFDVIFDFFGEDYRLPKNLVKLSIERSISNLRKGGELFTILPSCWKGNMRRLSPVTVERFLKELSRQAGLSVEWTEFQKGFRRWQESDWFIHITKK